MLRQIIKPTSEFYNVHIPKEYINQEVEILVLPFSYPDKYVEDRIESKQLLEESKIEKVFNSVQLDMSNFKFDRDEANER